ncbi:alpha-L-glutamate ligase [Kitasatospora sp. NPDC002965]|uniref:ATP-grasp domain-containing protein n=1 Tax=Kitasatospora sp. NPDC002965 TaxID=3154775 RepID=UPI0033B5FC37
MRIGLLASNPDHPVLAATAALLTARGHLVEDLDPTTGPGEPSERIGPGALADVYLLKAHTPRALALARHLEGRGAPVVNSAAATELCQDRTAMADLAVRAGLPFAATRTVAELADLVAQPDHPAPGFPFVVKSRHSRRHDLVARVDDAARLRALAGEWPGESVVVQPYLASTGWDQKLWVVAGQVFCARRRSELTDPGVSELHHPGGAFGPAELPADRARLALRVGEVFGLDVYGVDLLDGPAEPVVVDVNAFPGIRGQAGAPEALAALALRVGGAGPRSVPAQRPAGTGPGAVDPRASDTRASDTRAGSGTDSRPDSRGGLRAGPWADGSPPVGGRTAGPADAGPGGAGR